MSNRVYFGDGDIINLDLIPIITKGQSGGKFTINFIGYTAHPLITWAFVRQKERDQVWARIRKTSTELEPVNEQTPT